MPSPTTYSILLKKEMAHDDPIYCCVWTKIKPTGDTNESTQDFIVTGGLDCLVKVWTIGNNKLNCLHSLAGHSMAVVSVATSLDGHTLASTSMDSTMIIWDLVSGHKVHNVQTSAIDVWQVAFSPDSTQVVTGSHDGKLRIYNVEKGVRDRILETREQFALAVAWSRDGKYIGCGSASGAVSVVEAAAGKQVLTAKLAHPVTAVAFSHNSQKLLATSKGGIVNIFNVAGASVQCSLDCKTWARDARFGAAGGRVAVATDDAVLIADDTKLQIIHKFQEHTAPVCGVHFNAEGNKLVSVSKDKSIVIYECPVPSTNVKK